MLLAHWNSAWRYRHFIFAAIRSELKGKFARSKIGALWHILHPLAMATIYALVLSRVLGARLGHVDSPAAYSIYLLAGLSAWTLFVDIINRCMTIFIEYGNTLKKISFPRIALPLIVLGNALLNQLLLLASVMIVLVFFGHFPTVHYLMLPLGILAAAGLAFGIGILLGVLNVFVRDVSQVTMVATQLWFWVTPIVYTPDILPPMAQELMKYNPMAWVVQFYQQIILYQQWPSPLMLVYTLLLACVLVVFSLFVFRRAGEEIVDAL